MTDIIRLGADDLDKAYDRWYYTIWADVKDENQEILIDEVETALTHMSIATPKQWYVADGKTINGKFGLRPGYIKNKSEYLMFDHEGMNIRDLACFKLLSKDRWFTDIIDNARRLQKRKEEKTKEE